jgi:hypothetical protein
MECCIFVYKNKSQRYIKIFKTLSGSSPNYFLSHYTTFIQTQTGATVPLNLEEENAKPAAVKDVKVSSHGLEQ